VNPDGSIVCQRWENTRVFLRLESSQAAQNRFPDEESGKRKGISMKTSKSLFLGLALLLATSALAANKGSLSVQEPVMVNGTKLPAGDYKVQWEGTGPSVELSITQGKKVIAKVPAQIVNLEAPSSSDAVVVKKNGDGSKSLSEVRLSGKKFAIAVGEEAAKAEATR
jgi:hypothetical protein